MRNGLLVVIVLAVMVAGVVLVTGIFTVSGPTKIGALYVVNTFTGEVYYCRGAQCQAAVWEERELPGP